MQTFLEFVNKFQLNKLENKLDSIWKMLGVDIEFTQHFLQRINDERNNPEITIEEIEKIFVDTFNKYGKEIYSMKDSEIELVLTDILTKLNVPSLIRWNKNKRMIELVAKTVMRKNNFQTSNIKLKV